MKQRWIFYVAGRFLRSKRKNRGLSPSLFSIIGLAAGVCTLIAVISVMNGFQMGFIEDILEIGSYHVRLVPSDQEDLPSLLQSLQKLPEVEAAVPFLDVQTMVESDFSDIRGCNLRGIDLHRALEDEKWAEQLNLSREIVQAEGQEGVWIGSVLADALSVEPGDSISMISMAGDSFRGLRPTKEQVRLAGIFSSGYYEYDNAFIFASMDDVKRIASGKERLVIGIKLKRRWSDRSFLEKVRRAKIIREDSEIESWRSFNRSFFGALRMEKLTMMLILGIVFIVVGVNIKHSLERSVWEKREAIGLLRSVGARPGDIRRIFLIDGAIIGTVGGGLGMVCGLLIAENINGIFALAEKVVNMMLKLLSFLLSPFSQQSGAGFAIFSPAYFYIQEIPSRVLYRELLIIFLFALLASLLAAWRASKIISDFDPREILRYE